MDLDFGKHWHEALVFITGGVVGALAISWWMTGDPLGLIKSLLAPMPSMAAAGTGSGGMLESYIPTENIYSPWPEDYPMYPQYTQRPYASTADDFTAAHGYATRPYQRTFHAHQAVVDNHESWRIERDVAGNIIGISGSRQVKED